AEGGDGVGPLADEVVLGAGDDLVGVGLGPRDHRDAPVVEVPLLPGGRERRRPGPVVVVDGQLPADGRFQRRHPALLGRLARARLHVGAEQRALGRHGRRRPVVGRGGGRRRRGGRVGRRRVGRRRRRRVGRRRRRSGGRPRGGRVAGHAGRVRRRRPRRTGDGGVPRQQDGGGEGDGADPPPGQAAAHGRTRWHDLGTSGETGGNGRPNTP